MIVYDVGGEVVRGLGNQQDDISSIMGGGCEPALPKLVLTEREMARFEAKIATSTDGCWLWTGCRNAKGYGCLALRRKAWLAHRVMLTLVAGPIPDGWDVDHLCFVTACVNPAHLEAVTKGENTRRALRRRGIGRSVGSGPEINEHPLFVRPPADAETGSAFVLRRLAEGADEDRVAADLMGGLIWGWLRPSPHLDRYLSEGQVAS